MNKNVDKFFMKILCVIMVTTGAIYSNADAAERVAVRTNNTASRRTVTTAVKRNTTTTQPKTDTTTPVATTEPAAETTPTVVEEPAPVIIENKTIQFNNVLSSNSTSSNDASESDLADQVRKQRAAVDASEATSTALLQQQEALAFGKNTCDNGLRKCMSETCGSDFTKCALDGDTMFGEKLNKCRLKTTCSGEEFKLFTTEIKADRDFNVQMASYNAVIECGNNYNKCITTECGATFGKCLGKNAADRAIKKCATIAKNCTQQDSGLAARVGTVIGKLRETAEQDVKNDEKRLYDLRDLMRKQCQHLGATFDERSLDCVYTVNFFAGTNQSTPTASRKLYAGDSFICMQEYFGINATTFKENAYRETRSQTAASSAMLGSGLGTAAGLISSGAIGRALETQQAKKDYKKECESQGGKLKDGDCDFSEKETSNTNASSKDEAKQTCKDNGGTWILGKCIGGKQKDENASSSEGATAEILTNDPKDTNENSYLAEDGLNYWGYNFNGRCGKFSSFEKDNVPLQDNKCARLSKKGTWWTSFSWGIVYGEASCDKKHPDKDFADIGIIPCFCRLTAMDDNSVSNSKWVKVTNDNSIEQCQDACASECASYISHNENLRKELLGDTAINKTTENGNSFFDNIKNKVTGVFDNTKKKIADRSNQKAEQKNQEQQQQEQQRQQKAQTREEMQNLTKGLTQYK